MNATPLSTTSAATPAAPLAQAESGDTAVASFILGLLGLFFFNIVLGPLALVLGCVSLARGTARRGRALLGVALGAADLVLLAAAFAAHHGAIGWMTGL
jgi:hypothetical protein